MSTTPDLVICGTGYGPAKITIGTANAYDPRVFQRLVDLAAAALLRERPALVMS